MKYSQAAKVAAILLLTIAAASGDTLSVPIGPVAAIAGPIRGQTRARVLISLPIPDDVFQSKIDFAMLQFPAFTITDTHDLVAMQVHRVTTAWDPAHVSWTAPWQNPGGDFDSACLAWYAISAGDDHPVGMDLTPCVKAWQSGAGNYGIILKRPNRQGGGFAVEASNLREVLRSARFKLYFHHERQ